MSCDRIEAACDAQPDRVLTLVDHALEKRRRTAASSAHASSSSTTTWTTARSVARRTTPRIRRRSLGKQLAARLQNLRVQFRFLGARVAAHTVDPCLLATTERAQRLAVPNHKVSVFACLKRARARVDAQLLRRVERDQLERFLRREPAVAHGLGGLHVHAAREFIAVAVEAHDHASALQHGAVPRDRVHHFDLVRPPVAEARRAGAMLGDFGRDLVALEYMLQRCNAEAELLRGTQQHEDFVLAIAVAMHKSRALDDLGNGLELEVFARRHRARARCVVERGVGGLRGAIFTRRGEGVVEECRNAHARGRVARGWARDILTERELDSRGRALKAESLGVFAPADLDYRVAPANRIRRAVQLIHRHKSARELAVPVDVGRVDAVANPDLGGVGLRSLVHAAGDSGVAVAVDEAGRDVLALAVDDDRAIGRGNVGGDLNDLSVAHEHVAVLHRSLRAQRPNGGVLDKHGSGERGLRWKAAVLAERHGKLVFPEVFTLVGLLRAVGPTTASTTTRTLAISGRGILGFRSILGFRRLIDLRAAIRLRGVVLARILARLLD